MTYISVRFLPAVLAIFLLPVFAAGSDSNNNSPAPKSANEASADIKANNAAAPAANSANDPLLKLLVSKGVLSASEAGSLAGSSSGEMRDRLLSLLKDKGILSADDLSALHTAPSPVPAAALVPATLEINSVSPITTAQRGAPPQTPPTPPPSGPIAAIAPIRTMPVTAPKREGVLPSISIGNNIHIQPYGFYKTTAVYDTASPYGNDFPLPGFIGDINAPDKIAEFHIKTRALRVGSKFEWLDKSENITVTGALELDFEGNFSRANNRNISSIRSNAPQIRLGYGRIDWKLSDKTSLNFLGGQDWTPFGSSTLPNLIETTGLGVGFGTLYERDPQFRFGISHKFGGFTLEPDFAVVLPSFGNLPTDITAAGAVVPNGEGIGNQLGFGERQGTDSGRPELQARLVAQFQLDHAANVAPAQLIVSGVQSQRDVVVLASAVPTAFKGAFPTGARISSDRTAWTAEAQLPTRWFTLVAKYYNGSDLRYYFAGQILGPFNDTTGLTGVATAQSIDGSTTTAFGLRNGVAVIANSLPPRSQGGFVNLGLPISRWANADPQGRNAGWQMYLHYGYDQVLARDVRREGGGREKGDVGAVTLFYKLNPYVTFAVEESQYRTRALPLTTGPNAGKFPLFEGRPNREVNDFRSEIGPIFTF